MVKKLSVASLLTALSVVSLFVASVWPVRIAMTALASVLTAVIVMECNHKYAWLSYLAVSIIAFLMIPKKSVVYVYIAFLGYYPIIKLYIERLDRLLHEWIIKILFFSGMQVLAYFGLVTFFMSAINSGITDLIFKNLALVVATLEVLFVVYDLALSYFIGFYNTRLRGYFKF